MKPYQAILFDLDGTLLQTSQDMTDAINYTMTQFNLDTFSVKEVEQRTGNGIRKLIELCVPNGQEHPQFETIFQTYKEYYTKNCQHKTQPYDGIINLLQELQQRGYKMGIVTNKNNQAVQELWKLFFKDFIPIAIGQNDSMAAKPAPDQVDAVLKELGCGREHALFVGDSEVDWKTACNADLDCVMVSWGFRERRILEDLKCPAIIDQASQLLNYL